MSSQLALFLPRWLRVPPETFITVPQPGTAGMPLPIADEAPEDGSYLKSNWPCASTGLTAVTISAADEHKVITKYMIAFLNVHLSGLRESSWQDELI